MDDLLMRKAATDVCCGDGSIGMIACTVADGACRYKERPRGNADGPLEGLPMQRAIEKQLAAIVRGSLTVEMARVGAPVGNPLAWIGARVDLETTSVAAVA